MAGLFLAGLLAYGIGVYSFTQFLGPIQSEFGWNRAVLGGLMSAFWIAAPFVLVGSYALDLVGIRPVMIVGALIEAAGLLCSTRLSSPLEFFLVRFCMGAGKCLVVTPIPIAVARWFRHRTGFAFAVALCGWHVGGLVMAPLSAALIRSYGWRSAAVVLAGLLAGGMAVATWLMRPPPGAAPDAAGEPAPGAAVNTAWARPAVLVLIGLGTIVFYAAYAAFLSQLSPMLADVGLDPTTVGYATGSVAFSAIAGVLLAGLLTETVPPRVTGAALLGVTAALEVGAIGLHPGASLVAVGAVVVPLGLLVGGGDPVLIEALRRAVPLRRFGPAYGWWYLLCLATFAVAPVAIGAFFDAHASYRGAFLTMGAVTGVLALGWSLVRQAGPTGPEPRP